MSKIQMTPLEALKYVRFGLQQGNIDAVIRLLDDLIAELEARKGDPVDGESGGEPKGIKP